MTTSYPIPEVRPLIDWTYFFHAWKMNGKAPDGERQKLLADANALLDKWESLDTSPCRAIVTSFDARPEGDCIVLTQPAAAQPSTATTTPTTLPASPTPTTLPASPTPITLPMLRQQTPPWLSVSDFINPRGDQLSLFATSIDPSLPGLGSTDPYMNILAQTVADRLAEATAERVSREHPGLRPAVGYPIMPDMRLTFLIDSAISLSQISISLTESGAMIPHASVCGLIIACPKAHYFAVGEIGDDQRRDYEAAMESAMEAAMASRVLSRSVSAVSPS